MTPDIIVTNAGTIFVLAPVSERGEVWLDDNLADPILFDGRNYFVEHRYVGDIVAGMIEGGLEVFDEAPTRVIGESP